MTINPIQVIAFEIHKPIVMDGGGLDPIRVILHDIKPGEGRLIIECYGDSWSTYWGAMGKHRIMQFVCEADVDYITSRMLNSDGTQAQKAKQERYLNRIVYAVKEALRERHYQELTERYAVGSQWLSESVGVITVESFTPDYNQNKTGVLYLSYTTEANGGGHMHDHQIEDLKPCIPQGLPDTAGFYWWRETEADEWRMVQWVDFGDGHLVSYDIEKKLWGGRSMHAWQKHDPPGFWIAIEKPTAN